VPAADGTKKIEADKTLNNFKIHFAAAYRHHRQMQGETGGAQGFANASVTQANEDDLAEHAVNRDVVAKLTEANSRLAKQLDDNATSLK
jgi:hypothetical protein